MKLNRSPKSTAQSPVFVHSSRARADSSGHGNVLWLGQAQHHVRVLWSWERPQVPRHFSQVPRPPSVALLTMLAAGDGEQGRWFFELLSSVRVLFGICSIVALSVSYLLQEIVQRRRPTLFHEQKTSHVLLRIPCQRHGSSHNSSRAHHG